MVILSAILNFLTQHPMLAMLALFIASALLAKDRAPVEKAAGQYASLQDFITRHRNDADPDIIQDYEQELNRLGQAQN